MAPDGPSRDEVQQRIHSLYDQAETATGNYNATRAMTTGTRKRVNPVFASQRRRVDPALENVVRQWFDAARTTLGPTVPAVLPTDRMPGGPAGVRPTGPARRPGGDLPGRERGTTGRPLLELTAGPSTGASAGPVAELTARPVAALPAAPEPRQEGPLALPGPAAEPRQATVNRSKEEEQRKLAAARELLSRQAVQHHTSRAAIESRPAGDTWGTATLGTDRPDALSAVGAPMLPPAPALPAASVAASPAPDPADALTTAPAALTADAFAGREAFAAADLYIGADAAPGTHSFAGPGAPVVAQPFTGEGLLDTQPFAGPDTPVSTQPFTGAHTPVTAQPFAGPDISVSTQPFTGTDALLGTQPFTGTDALLGTQPFTGTDALLGTQSLVGADALVRGQALVGADAGVGTDAFTAVGGAPDSGYDRKATKALAFVRAQIGRPCLWGATGPDSYDAPALVQAAWKAAGVVLPRTAQDQMTVGAAIPLTDIQPGDLVFFHDTASHVGVCTGNGMMIHAPGPGAFIREESIFYAGKAAVHGAVRPA
ncbi:NlpC/P60 family protein [Streptomyces hygroscopicus]|uniref:NlpC/P60 family protein n=1 Tax=Streptomyces hygroscopicus TaxID=1912 RepID=UPI00223E9F17|nr:NlpC/P60 family protein [Streptomyces hygroscopicus]